jgi:hypothetical protein
MLAQGPREQQLALPLLLLLGQQLRVIALQTESPHLKLVAELYDKASQTLLQVCLIAMLVSRALAAEECNSAYRPCSEQRTA